MKLIETCLDANSNIRRTKEGYLVATPRIARSGIQLYNPSEVGLDSGIGRQIRVYRDESEVFSEPTIKSFAHRPITLGHPPSGEMVSADNWKELSVGHSVDPVTRDGSYVRVPLMLMDKNAIQSFENGTAQISCGYDCDIDPTPGVTDDGQEFDMRQINIRNNHIALVASARGGEKLRLGDSPQITSIVDINHTRNGEPLPPRTVAGQIVDYYTGRPVANGDGSQDIVRQPNNVEDAENIRASAWQDYKQSCDTTNRHHVRDYNENHDGVHHDNIMMSPETTRASAWDSYRQSIDTANNFLDFTRSGKGNPWHDPTTGEFTSGPGGSSHEPDLYSRDPLSEQIPKPHSGVRSYPPERIPRLPGEELSATQPTPQPLTFGNQGLSISLLPPGGAIDPKKNVEALHLASKRESEERRFATPEAAKAHAQQQASTWALHQSAHEQALEEIKKHKKKWERARVSTHVKTGPRTGFALTGPKSRHYSVNVDGTVVDEPQEEFSTMADSQQARDEYIRDLESSWAQGKPREVVAQHQPFSDSETERQRAIADMESAWKRKPAATFACPGEAGRPHSPYPVADQPANDSEAAYRTMVEDLSNAWRKRA